MTGQATPPSEPAIVLPALLDRHIATLSALRDALQTVDHVCAVVADGRAADLAPHASHFRELAAVALAEVESDLAALSGIAVKTWTPPGGMN